MFVGFLLAQNTANMPLWGQLLICCAIYCSYTYAGILVDILKITQVACEDIRSTVSKNALNVSKEAKEAIPVDKKPYTAEVVGVLPATAVPVRPDLSYNIGALDEYTSHPQSVIVDAESQPKVTH